MAGGAIRRDGRAASRAIRFRVRGRGKRGGWALAGRIDGAIDLTGRTNLRQLVAVLERASLVIAGDTGPMHIAAALGRPLVALYGPTNALLTGPFQRLDTVVQLDISCRPCFSRKCSHQSCLRWLDVEPVLKVAEEQMKKPRI